MLKNVLLFTEGSALRTAADENRVFERRKQQYLVYLCPKHLNSQICNPNCHYWLRIDLEEDWVAKYAEMEVKIIRAVGIQWQY